MVTKPSPPTGEAPNIVGLPRVRWSSAPATAPEAADAASTAVWIGRVLDRQVPLPKPIANQLACCLFASGFAEDFSQAKAIVAVAATGRPAAAA